MYLDFFLHFMHRFIAFIIFGPFIRSKFFTFLSSFACFTTEIRCINSKIQKFICYFHMLHIFETDLMGSQLFSQLVNINIIVLKTSLIQIKEYTFHTIAYLHYRFTLCIYYIITTTSTAFCSYYKLKNISTGNSYLNRSFYKRICLI